MSGNAVYAALFWTAYSAWFLLETYWSMSRRPGKRATGKDRGSYAVILLLLYTGIFLDFWLSFIAPGWAITWHRIVLFYLGVILILVGLAFRYYAIRVLGRFFTYSVAVQTGQTVIQSGPYRYIRHPSYSGAIITLLGVGLGLGNWAGLSALLATMFLAYAYRIRVEEAALIESLGQPYVDYRARTKRIIPFIF